MLRAVLGLGSYAQQVVHAHQRILVHGGPSGGSGARLLPMELPRLHRHAGPAVVGPPRFLRGAAVQRASLEANVERRTRRPDGAQLSEPRMQTPQVFDLFAQPCQLD